jgi:hypothetical protein
MPKGDVGKVGRNRIRESGGVAASTAASTAITGATEAEANFDTTHTLLANSLGVGSRVRVRAQGIHTSTTGAETHTLLVKLGTTTIASKAAVDPANNDIFYVDFEVIVRTVGATGTMVGAGIIATGASGTAAPAAVSLASTAIDTTADNVVAIAIDRQAAATDSDSARLDFFTVDIVAPAPVRASA